MPEHRSRNTMFYKPPPQAVINARKLPGWSKFHREAGKCGLFFDDVDQVGKSNTYTATSFRVGPVKNGVSLRYHVSNGRGDGPVGAILSAFDNAVSSGFKIDPSIRDHLAPQIDNLLGELLA